MLRSFRTAAASAWQRAPQRASGAARSAACRSLHTHTAEGASQSRWSHWAAGSVAAVAAITIGDHALSNAAAEESHNKSNTAAKPPAKSVAKPAAQQPATPAKSTPAAPASSAEADDDDDDDDDVCTHGHQAVLLRTDVTLASAIALGCGCESRLTFSSLSGRLCCPSLFVCTRSG